MKYKGSTAIVTGGGHGIGRALAEALAARGSRVVVADANEERANRVAARISGVAVPCDVGDPDSIDAVVSAAVKEFGQVDIAVSNAGITDVGPDLDSTVQQVRRIVDVNLLAHVWMAQAVLPGMIERRNGTLIQTISSAALITGPSGMGYTLTKHGALGFAEWVALNYGPLGVRVTCLCPNAVWTGMFGRDPLDRDSPPPDAAGLGEVLTPEQVAAAGVDALGEGRF